MGETEEQWQLQAARLEQALGQARWENRGEEALPFCGLTRGEKHERDGGARDERGRDEQRRDERGRDEQRRDERGRDEQGREERGGKTAAARGLTAVNREGTGGEGGYEQPE